MKEIEIKIEAGKLTVEFNGFVGDACQVEEARLRATMAKFGIKTEDQRRSKKSTATTNGEREYDKQQT